MLMTLEVALSAFKCLLLIVLVVDGRRLVCGRVRDVTILIQNSDNVLSTALLHESGERIKIISEHCR